MATMTVTVPDVVVSRIRLTFGRDDPATGNRLPATMLEVEKAIKSWLKGTVIEYETAIAANLKRLEVGGETW